METAIDIPIRRTTMPKASLVDWEQMEFGTCFSDHIFLCSYEEGEWQNPEIVPFQNLSLSPATLALHYGQIIFEGMKAFQMKDGSISIFRMEKHHSRLNRSLHRMCMPALPFGLFSHALEELVRLDRDWVPPMEGSAL